MNRDLDHILKSLRPRPGLSRLIHPRIVPSTSTAPPGSISERAIDCGQTVIVTKARGNRVLVRAVEA